MPEGDTLYRVAARLRPALEGKAIRGFEAKRLLGDKPKVGTVITSVEAKGKHLLVSFSNALVLETHLKMSGSWHLYRTGERWQKGAHLARCVIEVDDWVAVCFSAPVVKTHHGSADDLLTYLGPDLTSENPDLDVAVARFAEWCSDDTEIGVALLDQRVACGVGNVYKSEVLAACRLDPFTRVADVGPGLRGRLIATAHRMLRANLGGGERRTVAQGLAVYGRQGKPCFTCGTPIEMRYQGEHSRSTYWCPRCVEATAKAE